MPFHAGQSGLKRHDSPALRRPRSRRVYAFTPSAGGGTLRRDYLSRADEPVGPLPEPPPWGPLPPVVLPPPGVMPPLSLPPGTTTCEGLLLPVSIPGSEELSLGTTCVGGLSTVAVGGGAEVTVCTSLTGACC